MRARNIKPGFFKNELLGTEDPLVSILFIGLWCIADKEGILEDRPPRIKAEIFPYREEIDINRYLTVMQRLGFIQRYTSNGLNLIKIKNFKKHQNPHHTEKGSEYPQPQLQITTTQEDTTNNGELTVKQPLDNGEIPVRLLLIPDSLIPDSIKDSLIPDSVDVHPIKLFSKFWELYPKKIKMGMCETLWVDIFQGLGNGKSKDLYDKIIKSVELQKNTWNDPQYIPSPDNWLRDKRWLDVIITPIMPAKKETQCALCEESLTGTRYEYEGKKICGKCDMQKTKEKLGKAGG